MDIYACVGKGLDRVRQDVPLVHNITNFVVMQSTADALLAIGASPVMAHAPEEVEDIVGVSSALVLNIGTLSVPWVESMHLALHMANRRKIPVVIDPVGAGASQYRTRTALALLEEADGCILRGNASEIMVLAGAGCGARGVDSRADSRDAQSAAKVLAQRYACVVCVSGVEDLITDGTRCYTVIGGSPLMPKVTGMGCTATAITGAFAAVGVDSLIASLSAMSVMSSAGGKAAVKAEGTGSFWVHFLDALYTLSGDDICKEVVISRES